ncbi:hypothetical protein Moror_12096 [Moniliophthora roreri MCA 2997]|uniref:F-box domain-containing protein n=2 Tax=Moniliophthora roreri TaxID=221103 RepID=V2WTM7_MONRO|nr:hypothetical protein Moror_12096 [Moniliophthora roreri MCA 2997]KAI3612857.1 hypothetical protein WG66_005467 [Moniliophthora roreri]
MTSCHCQGLNSSRNVPLEKEEGVCRLPKELIDEMIDVMESNAGLLSCALVCRAWLPRCRERLFYNIQINKNTQDLANFPPKLVHLIRHLTLSFYSQEWSSYSKLLNSLSKFIPHLRCLTGITLKRFQHTFIYHRNIRVLSDAMQALEFFFQALDKPFEEAEQLPSNIERLVLECAGFQHIRSFHEFIGRRRFHHLKELVIVDSIILEERSSLEDGLPPRTGYEKLEGAASVPVTSDRPCLEILTARDSDEYLDALYDERCPLDMRRLRRLQLLDSQLETVEAMIGHSLTHLRIGTTQFDRLEPGCLPNVTHYCITLADSWGSAALQTPADLLSVGLCGLGLAAPNLKYLILEISNRFRNQSFQTIDPILAKTPLPDDARIFIRLPLLVEHHRLTETKDFFRNLLPITSESRGFQVYGYTEYVVPCHFTLDLEMYLRDAQHWNDGST